MKKVSFVLMGLSVSSGISAGVLAALNLLIWATLTFWLGSLLALIGFALVMWALLPKEDAQATASDRNVDECNSAFLEPIAAPA